jgi:hypothetical protein
LVYFTGLWKLHGTTVKLYQLCIYRGLGSLWRTILEAENTEVGNVIQEKLYIQAKGLGVYSWGGLKESKNTVEVL